MRLQYHACSSLWVGFHETGLTQRGKTLRTWPVITGSSNSKRTLFTILWLALGVFVICFYPMSSVFDQPTTRRVCVASAFLICLGLNILFLWVPPKSRSAMESVLKNTSC